jgi:hypothetical protein
MRKLNNDATQIVFGFWAIFIVAIIVLIIFAAIAVFWGLVGLIGLLMVLASIWYASKTGWSVNTVTLALMLIGMILMIVSILDVGGLEIMQFQNPVRGLF